MRRAKQLALEQLQPFLFEPNPSNPELTPKPIEWCEIFQNDHPVEIEVGFGKGLFLLNSAAARPDTNFFGIEIERKFQLFTANRIAKRNISNVIVACADARLLFSQRIVDQSVAAIYIFFPDPWWKKRHHKRRLFTEDFADQCIRVLQDEGRLYVVSDVNEYFEMIRTMLDQKELLSFVESPAANDPQHDMDYLTNYERKFRKEQRPVYRALYRRHTR